MRSEWKTARLSEISDIQTGPFGSQLHKEDYVLEGTPIVTVEHLGSKYFTMQNLPYVSDADKKRLIKYTLTVGDIVFSRVGSVDRCSYVGSEHNGWMFSGRCLRLRPDVNVANPEFLYYYFTKESVKQFVRNIAVGATMPSINTSLLGEVQVVLPSLPEQRAIAATLSCLDDKIELNNKINANLEAQAQAIFKSWFVDFEPFQNGEFVDSELGRIPKGWRVGTLTKTAYYLNGLAMQKFRPSEGEQGIPVLKIKELRQGVCDSSSELCSENIKTDYIVNDGDVIFSWSGSLLVDIWCGGICGLNQHLFKVTSCEYDKWFYYFWTKHYLDEFVAIAAGKATTMGHIKRSDLDNSLVVIPYDSIYKEATSLLTPMINQIIANRIQTGTLAALRDALLPKLMSGEIKVPLEVQ